MSAATAACAHAASVWRVTGTADHHSARPPPLPRQRADPALPRTLGDRVGLSRAPPHHARRACPALRDRAGLEQEVWALLTSTSCCRMAMSTRSRPAPPPTPTGPASPPPCRPPATNSSPPPGSALTARPTHTTSPSTGSESTVGPCWPRCCPPVVPATARARSSARHRATSTATAAARGIDGRHRNRHPRSQPLDLTPRARGVPSRPRAPRPPTRRDQATALLGSGPRRAWTSAETPHRALRRWGERMEALSAGGVARADAEERNSRAVPPCCGHGRSAAHRRVR